MQLKNNLAEREEAILFGARGFESQATCNVYGRHRQNYAISDITVGWGLIVKQNFWRCYIRC